jgi:hypothetical protein
VAYSWRPRFFGIDLSTKEFCMRTLLTTLFALLVGVGSLTVARAQDPVIEVYKSPT